MKKVLAILSVMVVIVLCVGGGVFINQGMNFTWNDSKESELIKNEQERMANYLYNSYENIKKIKFTSFDRNISTGTWSSNAIVNDTVYVTFGIHRIGEDSSISFDQHISQSDGRELVRKTTVSNSVSNESVEIIYFQGGN